MPYSYEAVQGNQIHSSTFRQPDPKTSARIYLAASSSIEGAGLVNHCSSRKGSALDEEHLVKAQAILGGAIPPEKVDVIAAPNEFNQAIGRTKDLWTLFRKRLYDIFMIIGQSVIELGMA